MPHVPITDDHRAAFRAAIEADAKLGADATKWIDDLPEAPPISAEYTTAVFVTKPTPPADTPTD
jgi:hypothetical protein